MESARVGTSIGKLNPPLAIVVGGFVNGLGLVRALHELQVPVAMVTTTPYDMAQHSRYVSEHHSLPQLDRQPDSLVELLLRKSAAWSGAVVLPTTDSALTALAAARAALGPHYHLAIPPAECVDFILDKRAMMQAAAEAGLVLPRAHGPATPSLLQAQGLVYPVVVKPARAGEFFTRFGEKVLPMSNPAALGECIHRLGEASVEADVFDVVPGLDSQIYAHCVYIGADGSLRAECTVRKLRQSPPGFGIARAAEVVTPPAAVRKQSLALLRHIDYRGFAAIEFKHDVRDGSFRFIEVNGRSVAYNALLRKADLDIVALTLAELTQLSPPRATRHPPNGLWDGIWVHLHADLLRAISPRASASTTFRSSIGGAFEGYSRSKVFAVWDALDPRPFAAQWSKTAGHFLRWAAGSRSRSLSQGHAQARWPERRDDQL